jgi:peptidyl-prolyl cis-trans isomerase C
MKKMSVLSAAGALAVLVATGGPLLLAPSAAQAQNVAIVNGKPVPKSRVTTLLTQASRQGGQPVTPELEQRVRDEVVLREIFMQEAERRGLTTTPDYRAQVELARQSILIRQLFEDQEKKNPVTEAEIQAEYDKFKAQAGGTEYRASHILVEKEDEAKALIAQIKGGAKFDELAKKHSKDPGSGARGGDLDFAPAGAYVPEFSQAMVKLEKGKMTEAPVRTQFGWHIIRLEDQRQAQFPPFEEVKTQIQQRLSQQRMAQFRDDIRAKAKTDYKFAN